jgi:hypothetical protein
MWMMHCGLCVVEVCVVVVLGCVPWRWVVEMGGVCVCMHPVSRIWLCADFDEANEVINPLALCNTEVYLVLQKVASSRSAVAGAKPMNE